MKEHHIQEIDLVKEVLSVLYDCMDDYLFILDFQHEYFCISPHVVNRFNLENNEFYKATEMFKGICHPDDIPMLFEDLLLLQSGQKDFHDLEYRWLDQDGEPIWINCRGKTLKDDSGNIRFLVGCINEIGKKQRADNTSGLLNEQSLKQDFLLSHFKFKKGFALRIGVDQFKDVNENHGMEYGDMILRKTAKCIEEVIGSECRVYKIVADEYFIICVNHDLDYAYELYHDIKQRVNAFVEENNYAAFFTLSGGIIELNHPSLVNYNELMKLTEFSLNEAKSRGRNQCYIYDDEDYQLFLRKKELIKILHQAVRNSFEGFELLYQPIVHLNNHELYSVEALLRFHHKELGQITPDEFIPLLEETGLIIPVGRYIMDQAIDLCEKINNQIPIKVQINISYIQVLKSDILQDILSRIKDKETVKNHLCVELTESGFIESNEKFIYFCNHLKENGISLALDDFGTGYSNFHYLYHVQPSCIKIDRGLTLSALENGYEKELLHYMIDMAHSVGVKICVEGIETKKELDEIALLKPDYIQGFYFDEALNQEELLHKYIKAEH